MGTTLMQGTCRSCVAAMVIAAVVLPWAVAAEAQSRPKVERPLPSPYLAVADDWQQVVQEETQHGLGLRNSRGVPPPGAVVAPERSRFWHPRRIEWLEFARDSRSLVTISGDEAWIWALPESIEAVMQNPGEKPTRRVRLEAFDGVERMAASADLSRIAVVSDRGHSVVIWNTTTGRLECRLPYFESQVGRLGFLPRGDAVWTLEGPVDDQPAWGERTRASAIRWDGQPLPRRLSCWNLPTGERRWSNVSLTVPPAGVHASDKELLIGGADQKIRRWNVTTGESQPETKIEKVSVADGLFSADGRLWMVSLKQCSTLRVYDAVTGARLEELRDTSSQPADLDLAVIGRRADGRMLFEHQWGMSSLMFGRQRLVTLSADGNWLVGVKGRFLEWYGDKQTYSPSPLLRALFTRVAMSEPLGVAIYWEGNFERVATLGAMTFHVTTPNGTEHQLQLQVAGLQKPESTRSDDQSLLMDLSTEGVKVGVPYGKPSVSRWKGEAPNLNGPGKYRLRIAGTLHLLGGTQEKYQTGEVMIERAREGVVPLTEIRERALAMVRKQADLQPKTEVWDSSHKKNPLTPFHIVESVGQVRVASFSANYDGLSADRYRAFLLPDGTPVQITRDGEFLCLAAGTQVETDAGLRPVEQLRVGDRLWGYNLQQRQRVPTIIRHIQKSMAHRTYRLGPGLRTTAEHPILVNGQWKNMVQIRPEDQLFGTDLKWVSAGRLECLNEPVAVFDLTVDEPHTYFAGGALVHNKSVSFGHGALDPWKEFAKSPGPSPVPIWLAFDRLADWLPGLEYLQIYKGQFDNQQMAHVARLSRLRVLSLDDCPLTDAGLGSVSKLTQLRQLSLTDTKVEGAGLVNLSAPALWSLDLSGAPLRDQALKPLSRLQNLEKLVLARSPLGDDGIANVRGLTRLSELNLSDTRITDQGLSHLADLKKLQSLNLSGTRLNGKGLTHVGKLRMLQSLDLSGTQVDDESMAALAGCSQLQTVRLANTRLTSAGLRSLAALSNLTTLDLSGTAVDDRGLVHLRDLHFLKQLDLTRSKVTGLGLRDLPKLDFRSFREAVQLVPTRLTTPSLDALSQCGPKYALVARWLQERRAEEHCIGRIMMGVGSDGARLRPVWQLWTEQQGFELPQWFDWNYEWGGSTLPWYRQVWRATDRVAEVYLNSNDLQYLPAFRYLHTVVLQGEQGDGTLARLVAGGPYTFKVLKLSGHEITNDGLQHLQKLKSLEVLEITRARIDRKGLEHLRTLKLKRLKLHYSGADDDALAELGKWLSLEELDVTTGAEVTLTASSPRHLRQLKNLRKLTLVSNGMGTEGLTALAELTKLESLALGLSVQVQPYTAEDLAFLRRLPALRELRVHFLRDTDRERLSQLLPRVRIYDRIP